ncbi:MAG: DUF167 domain-containing protein [Pseudonocardia sp.]
MIRAVKAGEWQQATDRTVIAAGIELLPGEYSERLVPGADVSDASATAALPGSSGLVVLDTEATQELAAEGLVQSRPVGSRPGRVGPDRGDPGRAGRSARRRVDAPGARGRRSAGHGCVLRRGDGSDAGGRGDRRRRGPGTVGRPGGSGRRCWNGARGPALVVAVRARAVDGKVNAAVVAALAGGFGLPRAAVELVSGRRGRDKTVELNGDSSALAARLAELLAD